MVAFVSTANSDFFSVANLLYCLRPLDKPLVIGLGMAVNIVLSLLARRARTSFMADERIYQTLELLDIDARCRDGILFRLILHGAITGPLTDIAAGRHANDCSDEKRGSGPRRRPHAAATLPR